MKAVTRFEANLLRILHAILQHAPVQHVLPLLAKPLPRPKCLGRDAVLLIEDTLAKGCVQFLARRGWQRERYLRAGRIAAGRLWERTPPQELGLAFSGHALEFLVQLVAGTLGTTVPSSEELELGDRFLFFLALETLRKTEHARDIQEKWLPLQEDGLCRLAFPEELPDGAKAFRIDWLVWTTGQGAAILETLQGWLAERWTQVERKKGAPSTVSRLRALGATQQRVYGEFLDALASVQRWDLARCFLDAARRLLHDQPTAQRWLQNLDLRKERIADRLAIYQEVLAFLRQMERLQAWQRQALATSYFDEGYQASQLWKADWERYGGDPLCACARSIVREVEPLK